MEEKIYRVYGEDRYELRTFTVGDYKTKEEAEAKVNECRASVLSQPEDLRDRFWMAEMTQEQIAKSNKIEEEEREARLNARYYDRNQLKKEVEALLEDLRNQLQDKHLTYQRDLEHNYHDAKSDIKNREPNTCYHWIMLCADSYSTGNSNINATVYVGDYKADSAVQFFHSEDDMKEWIASTECIEATLKTTEKLIAMFFED